MSATQNLETAHRYIASLSAGAGPEDPQPFFTADARQEELPNRLAPDGATRDLEAVKNARARGQALLAAERFEVGNAFASGDRWRWR